jgi:hypothetical protein
VAARKQKEKLMDIDDIDNLTAACVLRRQQEVCREHAAKKTIEMLKKQDMPPLLIKKVIDNQAKTMHDIAPKVANIMAELEVGNAGFDETVLTLFQLGLDATVDQSEELNKLIQDTITSGELDEYFENLEKEKAAGEDQAI